MQDSPSLEDFFNHLQFSNPFGQDRVSDPSEAEVDVEAIHHRQYQKLVNYAQMAQRERRGVGVVLWGEAGVGKSHLLARFNRWAANGDRACYVFLHNLHVDPERLPRYVLKSVVSRLTSNRRRGFSDSPLYRLLLGLVRKALATFSGRPDGEHTATQARECFENYIAEHAQRHSGVDDPAIDEALFKLFFSAYRAGRGHGDEAVAAAAVRWLSGDILDREEAERLGLRLLGGEEQACLPDNQAIERVLLTLMELCRLRNKPFVLVFDQVENLAPEEVQSLTRFCHTLLDHSTNLLVITSGVQRELLDAKQAGIIGEASWGRIAQDSLMLELIRPSEAIQLLQARIENFFESFITLPQIKPLLTSGDLFPLGKDWLNAQIGDALELKPRHVIGWARKRWCDQVEILESLGPEKWQQGWPHDEIRPPLDRRTPEQIIDEKVEEKIHEQVRRRELDPSGLPPDVSNLCGLVEALLDQCQQAIGYSLLRVEHPPRRRTQKPTYDLLVRERTPDGTEVATGLAFIVTGSKTSTAASLRRLVEDPEPPEHVLVVCDDRQPMARATAGDTYFEQLNGRGADRFHVVELSFQQYAQLDALEAVIGEARSGDLEAALLEGTRALTPDEVIASHHRRDRYRQHPLLRELLCEEPAPPPVKPKEELDRDDVRQFIRAQLALTMGLSSIELAQKYHARLSGKGQFSLSTVKVRLEEVAQEMHHEDLLLATPTGDYLYLLNRPGR